MRSPIAVMCRSRASLFCAVVCLFLFAPADADALFDQDDKQGLGQTATEPPGRDLFIPYLRKPDASDGNRARQLENVEQIKLLAEMNKLTVELVRRRSNRELAAADTPALVRRIKELAKKLHEE